jgi:hypothetical protein
MPHNDSCDAVIAALKRQHDRIGDLLSDLNDGRWWPDDPIGGQDAGGVLALTRRIEECVNEISSIVTTMRD